MRAGRLLRKQKEPHTRRDNANQPNDPTTALLRPAWNGGQAGSRVMQRLLGELAHVFRLSPHQWRAGGVLPPRPPLRLRPPPPNNLAAAPARGRPGGRSPL